MIVGQRKVPHGIWTSEFPADPSTLRFFKCSSLLVANIDKGKGAYVLKVLYISITASLLNQTVRPWV